MAEDKDKITLLSMVVDAKTDIMNQRKLSITGFPVIGSTGMGIT